MHPTIYLEYSYTPTNYFEGPLYDEREQFYIEIDAGKIRAILKKSDNTTDFLKISEEIENYFRAIQIITHRKYSLSSYTLYKERPDGGKHINIFIPTGRLELVGQVPDITITRPDGIAVKDTKRERLEEEKKWTELLAKFRNKDKTVQKIINSYSSAVNDPANELIYLYEIRDSLSERFGGEKRVEKALSILATEWSDFGKLANKEPVQQGRHRGKNLGTLRNATGEELFKARGFSKKLILEYLKLLDNNGISPTI